MFKCVFSALVPTPSFLVLSRPSSSHPHRPVVLSGLSNHEVKSCNDNKFISHWCVACLEPCSGDRELTVEFPA